MAARSRLVEENLPLVHSIARRFIDRGLEFEDLVQIGCVGLLKAIQDFDLDFPVKFSTFAVPKIMGEIKQQLQQSAPLKVTRSLRRLAGEALQAKDTLAQALGRSPTIAEIAAELNTSPEEVVCALEAVAPVQSLQSKLDSDDEARTLEDVLSAPDSHEHFLLRNALASLDPEERRLIILRYFAEKSQSQVAEEFGMSQAQISRMEARIIRQLRHDL